MRKDFIEGFGLKPTTACVGRAFEYDIKFYKDSLGNLYGKCNSFGEPASYISVFLYNGGVLLISEELVSDIDGFRFFLELELKEDLLERANRLINIT